MDKAVFGIAKDELQAITITDDLKAAGFSNDDVSVLFSRHEWNKRFRS